MRLEFSASIEGDGVSRRARFAAFAALATAALVAIASLGGIVARSTYARETVLWRTQGIGQDWANLLADVPWLVISALLVLRGSRRGRLLLGGALVYTAYTYAIYAFDVHFNALFLVYCGALGTPVYALLALAPELRDAVTWFEPDLPRRIAGGFAMVCALAFALLWLSQIITALLRGTAPVELDAVGLMTNPVHVLDLALVLPAMFAGGWLLWHRRPLGYALVPVLVGFMVLMGIALVAMTLALVHEDLTTNLVLVIVLAVFTLAGAALLAWMLHAMRREPTANAIARITAG